MAESGDRQEIGTIVVEGRDLPVTMDPDAGRFEVRVGDHVALMTFHLRGSTLSLIHTETPPALRGHGVAGLLVQTVLQYARDRGLKVKPYCPFVAAYIREHPGYRDLVDPTFAMPSQGSAVDDHRRGE
jgi:predicted GNAT family acetyltransferase